MVEYQINEDQIKQLRDAIALRLPDMTAENTSDDPTPLPDVLQDSDFSDYLDALAPPMFSAESVHRVGQCVVTLSKVVFNVEDAYLSVETQEATPGGTIFEKFEIPDEYASCEPFHSVFIPKVNPANGGNSDLTQRIQDTIHGAQLEKELGVHTFTSANFEEALGLVEQCTDANRVLGPA